MLERTFAELREEFAGTPLDERTMADDPIEQFRYWFDDAVRANIRIANSMALATTSPEGQPSVRMLLLKDYDQRGFVFYTNYQSRKAQELERAPRAALLFWWDPLERQIRIEGTVERVSASESDAYFATRPRASNLSAMASPQSQVVPDRGWLEARVEEQEREWSGKGLVRPDEWGGYRVIPQVLEFWQGQRDRLHDRVRYYRKAGVWQRERLAP